MHISKDKKDIVVPTRMNLDSTFTFACEKDIACFMRCCKDAHIILTPCDIIRMKQKMELSSDEFLYIYTTLGHIEKTELPVPVLKMREDEKKFCPFLGESGCTIYDDRPSTCRYYPIGFGMFHDQDSSADHLLFALIKEGQCLGHGLGKEYTIKEWRIDQGLIPYDEVNASWTELILRRKSLGPFTKIPDKSLQMFFLGSYNVDRFRRFVFDSPFLKIYDIPDERIEKISKKDDLATLELANDWLKTTLFGDKTLEVIEQIAKTEEL